jgi:N-acetylglucosaminyldiphosphoundecaprenol N-acetyl-beta-D-mannosaminyltransferase
LTSLGITEIAQILLDRPIAPGLPARLIVTSNVDHVVCLRRNEDFRAAYGSAFIVTADGMPVFLYARLRGTRIRRRAPGSDLIAILIDRFDCTRHRPFFVCANAGVAEALSDRLSWRGFAPGCAAFAAPPFGFEDDEAYSRDLGNRIRGHGTTHLVLGVGAPKSEVWAHRHRPLIGSCYVLPVGAGLEYAVDLKRRAPAVLRRVGLEWAWRLVLEPKRLFRRYAIDSWPFLAAIRDDLRGRPLVVRELHVPAAPDGQ